MTSSYDNLLARLEHEVAEVWKAEPDEIRLMRTGLLPNQAGSYGQYWSTWDFANGMMRDFSMYTMYPIYRLALDEDITLTALQRLVAIIHPPYSVYLGYSGYETLMSLDADFLEVLPTLTDKSQFLTLYHEFLLYTNKLAAWSYHYFPWELGVLFPQRSRGELEEQLELVQRASA